MSTTERMKAAAAAAARADADREQARAARLAGTRPRLTADGVVDYLDWITTHVGDLPPAHVATHMQAAELAIRTRATDAQAKDTQHTLVRDGIIDQPQ